MRFSLYLHNHWLKTVKLTNVLKFLLSILSSIIPRSKLKKLKKILYNWKNTTLITNLWHLLCRTRPQWTGCVKTEARLTRRFGRTWWRVRLSRGRCMHRNQTWSAPSACTEATFPSTAPTCTHFRLFVYK